MNKISTIMRRVNYLRGVLSLVSRKTMRSSSMYSRRMRGLAILFFMFIASQFSYAKTRDEKAKSKIPFLTLSDIHFDPFVGCYNRGNACGYIQQLRSAPASSWGSILAANESQPSQYRQDTNYPLLQSALKAAKLQAVRSNAQFVIVLGDFLAHNYREYYKKYTGDRSSVGYREFVRKTLSFLTMELNRTFPSIDVYPLIGNNDTYQYDYASTPNGAFFNDAAGIWSGLIKNPANRSVFMNSFYRGGYYAVTISGDAKLKLILLNSVLFATNARGKNIDTAATNELTWLHDELAVVKSNQQMALLAMHIPAGIEVYVTLQNRLFRLIELWKRSYVLGYEANLKQFAPEIAGIFAGHLHMDWFQVLTLSNANRVPVSGTPAISPIYGNNQGFKIYTYSPDSKEITNFETYYTPIDQQLSWLKEYNYKQIYQPTCRLCSIVTAMNTVKPSSVSASYYKHFYAVGVHDQSIEAKWDPYYWCAIRPLAPQQYWTCVA